MKILHLETSPHDAERMHARLRVEWPDCVITHVGDEAGYLAALRSEAYHIILSDYEQPAYGGLEALAAAGAGAPDTPFIFVADGRGEEVAVDALHHGAADYLRKDQLKRLAAVIRRALRESQGQRARLAAEQAVRQVQRRQADLIDSVDGIVWEAEAARRAFTFVSAQAERLLGYPVRQWLDEPDFWCNHLHPEDRDAAVAYGLAHVAGAKSHQFEYRMLASDGRAVWLRDHVQVVAENDRATGLRGIIFDITARKQAELALRESEERFRLANRAIFNVLWDQNCRTKTIWWNEHITTVFGYTQAEAGVGPAFWLNSLHPEDAERVKLGVERTMNSRAAVWSDQYRFRRKDGTYAVVDDRAIILRNDAGQPLRMIGAIQDITERKAAEARLLEQATVIDHAPIAIDITDLAHRVTYCNRGAMQLYGLTREELMGRTADELFTIETMTRLAAARDATFTHGRWSGEVLLVTKAGHRIYTELLMALIHDDTGRPTGRLSIAADISKKKLIEEQFLRAQRLEGLGMLAAGIAHDLNNVLTPILMAGPMLRVHATDPQDLRLLESLERSAERGANLVRQILAFAHGTAGEPRLLQIRHLIRDIIGFIEETFPKSIQLEQNIPANAWSVSANPTQIHQVLLNLCVNARDAMPNGGTLRLALTNQRLDVAQAENLPGALPGPFAVIEIGDNGTGIPPDVLAHIWEPFYTTKGEGKGTGLGLSTVRGIVESHRGFITVQTTPGAGTTFQIYLPAVETEDVTSATAHPFLSRGNGELILIVDDEAATRDVTHTTLARHGYRVLVAGGGAEAVSIFIPRANEIRLVITDVHMPTIDGLALAQILGRIKPGLPILTMSGLSSDPRNHPDNSGSFTSDFLAKPFKPAALLVKVHALLQPAGPPAKP